MGGGTGTGGWVDLTDCVRTVSITFTEDVTDDPFGPDEFYIPEDLLQTYELNLTFDLDTHDAVLLYNALVGPYNWQNESILDRLLEELRHLGY